MSGPTGNRKSLMPWCLAFRDIIAQSTVGMSAGDGMYMQVNGIHFVSQRHFRQG